MRSLKSFGLHLGLFFVIEIIFVFVLFREIPETGLFTTIGIAHISYRALLLLAGLGRSYAKTVTQRFLATYIPVVYHLIIHLWIIAETIATHKDHWEYENIWLIIGVIFTWILIYRWETLLHRKYHCDTHHQHTHQHCREDGHTECEEDHE